MKKIMDGNEACSYAAYPFTEVAGIYPITPASTMAEVTDKWASEGKKNFFGLPVKVVEMESEAGAIGLVHGSVQSGCLTSTYTASQGLLLMIPNMYKIAGQLFPCVINVSARSLATHALSIFGDHQDIYAVRQTGFAILASSSVQECMDLTAVSYLSTIKGSVPFVNFNDGFRTSHELQKIDVLDMDKVYELIDQKALSDFRNRALNPINPVTRGTSQNEDIYFQVTEARNEYYNKLPDIVSSYMDEINKITGQNYKPFNYYGSATATKVIVAMGSVCETIKETVDYLTKKGQGILTATILLVGEFCEPRERHIVSVFKVIQELLSPTEKKGRNRFQELMELLPDDHKAKWFAGSALNTGEQSMASVMSTALSRLNAFLNSELEQLLCFDTEIDAEKFCSEKSAIFIIMPEEAPTTFFMVSLIIQQLYREILAVADENGGKLKKRCVFYCDEYGTDRKSTRLNSSHPSRSRMPSSA